MAKDYVTLARTLAEPLASSLGLALWGVEFVMGGRPTLRIFVEKAAVTGAGSPTPDDVDGVKTAQGVSVDECAELSRLLGLALEVDESFDTPWTLEISSPGLERVFFSIGQLRAYLGQDVSVALNMSPPAWPKGENVQGRKRFVGTLKAVEDGSFTLVIAEAQRLQDEPAEVEIEWGWVRRAHLIHVFPEPGLPGKDAKKASKRGGIV